MIKEEIKKYITRQTLEQAKILRLSTYTRKGQKHRHRYFYYRMEKHIENFLENGEPRWITIAGLRGVGKTTILAQIFAKYQKKFKERVLYISMDEVVQKMNGTLFEVLDAYEDILGESFHSLKENVLLLVDEVHTDEKWQDALKTLHDKSRRVLVVSTGSSAIAINKTADIARRLQVEKMHPLRFTEYTMLAENIIPTKGLGEQIRTALLESDNADEVYEKLKILEKEVHKYWQKVDKKRILPFIQYHATPSTLKHKEPTAIYRALNRTVERIIQKDLPKIHPFSLSVLNEINVLLYLTASSDTHSASGFTRDLKTVSGKTVENIFRTLEKAELLLRIYPFSTSAPKKVRKPSKYLFCAPSIRAALIHLTDPNAITGTHKGKLLEDSVVMHLYNYLSDSGVSFGYDDAKGGADIILSGRKKIAIEIGWNKKSRKQVFKTMHDIQGDYGLLITDALVLEKKENVVTIPFEFFFLI